MNHALGILEIRGYAPAMAALDAAERAGTGNLGRDKVVQITGEVLRTLRRRGIR